VGLHAPPAAMRTVAGKQKKTKKKLPLWLIKTKRDYAKNSNK